MKFLYTFIIISSLVHALQDAPCSIPSDKIKIPMPNFTTIDTISEKVCGTWTGTQYNCSSTYEKVFINENLEQVSTYYCNYRMIEERYTYVKNCGSNAFEDSSTHECICNIPSMIYDNILNSCTCPQNTVLTNEGTCEFGCENVSPGFTELDFNENECTRNYIQNQYNQNNTDNRIITDALWHCDKKCYFKISPFIDPYTASYYSESVTQSECNSGVLQALYNASHSDGNLIDEFKWHLNNKCYYTLQISSDNNSSENNTTDNTDTSTNDSTDNNDTGSDIDNDINNNGSIAATLVSMNNKLGIANNKLSSISHNTDKNGDMITNAVTGASDKNDNNLLNIRTDNQQHFDDLSDSLFAFRNENASGFQTLTNAINNLHTNSSDDTSTGTSTTGNSEPNTTINFDSTGIIQANNNTTNAIDDLKNMERDKVDDTLDYLNQLDSTITDFTDLVDDLKSSMGDIKSSFTNVYHPNFQRPNSCIYNFSIMGSPMPFDLCRYSSILRPFIIFILTTYFMVLIVRLHIFFISVLMTRHG